MRTKEEIESEWHIYLVHMTGGGASISSPSIEECRELARKKCEFFPKSYVLATLPYKKKAIPLVKEKKVSINDIILWIKNLYRYARSSFPTYKPDSKELCGSMPKEILDSWSDEIKNLYNHVE